MRFGTISLTHAPFEDLVARWRWFESLGFDSAWLDDDFVGNPSVSDYEAWTVLGRDPATIERSIFAFRVEPDPFSSLDWFDEYVGAYEEIGIGEIVFLWPPDQYVHAGAAPVPAERVQTFERIAAERIGRR